MMGIQNLYASYIEKNIFMVAKEKDRASLVRHHRDIYVFFVKCLGAYNFSLDGLISMIFVFLET